MKVRDNWALFSVMAAGLGLEAFVLFFWWTGAQGEVVVWGRDSFLLWSQVYLLALCALVYAASRWALKPLHAILDAIGRYGRAEFGHRIAPSKIQEWDELARQLNGMAARLAELDTLKNDFVANVSHELRSPLAAMEDYAKLLLDEKLSSRGRENLERVDANLTRLRRLVEDLLDVSRLESGGVRLQYRRFKPEETLREAVDFLKPRAQALGLKVRVESEGGLPTVESDPARVRQILANLLDNAIKYNKAGGEILLSLKAEDGRFSIYVRDTGVGIAEEDLPKLFERFQRLKPKSLEAARVRGAGLGLAISRDLARALGGDVDVESREGAGSVFRLTLPMRRGA